MAEQKKTYPLLSASKVAADLADYLKSACKRIEIAGSIRRRKAEVHDIDLVAWVDYERMAEVDLFENEIGVTYYPRKLITLLKPYCKFAQDAKKISFYFVGIPAELYLAEPDGSNFEALLQMRTGSEVHNAWLARRAQSMKMHYRAGYGIYKLGQDGRFSVRVDDGTERGVYQALSTQYLEPERRG